LFRSRSLEIEYDGDPFGERRGSGGDPRNCEQGQ
jgi:hypothetical protein